MKPIFKEGDIAFISPLSFHPFICNLQSVACNLSLGDCAVYNFEGQNLLHRVIKIVSNGIWVQDDGQVMPLHFIKWSNVLGRVASRNPLKNGFSGLIYFNLRKIYRNILRVERIEIE